MEHCVCLGEGDVQLFCLCYRPLGPCLLKVDNDFRLVHTLGFFLTVSDFDMGSIIKTIVEHSLNFLSMKS